MKKNYRGQIAEVTPADGVRGFLLYSPIPGQEWRYVFRVYGEKHGVDGNYHDYVDYEVFHNDLEITIHGRASFYEVGENHYLDHHPDTLGLEDAS